VLAPFPKDGVHPIVHQHIPLLIGPWLLLRCVLSYLRLFLSNQQTQRVNMERDKVHDYCERLQSNDPTLDHVHLRFGGIVLNDENALRLAQAMVNNTYCRQLTIEVEPILTAQGATNLEQGIRQTKITSLALHGDLNQISAEVQRILWSIIANKASTWTELDIYCYLDDESVCGLQRALQQRSTPLPNFTFYMCEDVSPHGASVLSKLLANCQHVGFVQLQDVPADILQIVYRDGIGASTTAVQSVSIYGNAGDEHEGLAALLLMLEKFEFNDPEFDEDDEVDEEIFLHINAALGLSTHLRYLTMSTWESGDNLMRLLGPGIQNNRSITVLTLSENSITDAGVAAFLQNWDQESTIEFLDLSQNSLTIVGAQQLLLAVEGHPSLQQVDISDNYKIGFTGLMTIAREVLPNLRLESLYLAGCASDDWDSIGTEDKKIRATHSLAIAEAVRRNHHLHHLELDFLTQAEDECYKEAKMIIWTFLLINGGRYLLPGNHGVALWPHVFENHCDDINFFFLREQPTLIPAPVMQLQQRKRRGKRDRVEFDSAIAQTGA
jgi:hypothetical protein